MVVEILLKWAIPFVCGGVITGLIANIKMHRRSDTAMRNGLQCLLRAEIIRSHEKYAERGYCPVYAKEALRREYDAYHALGGNDVATSLYNDTIDLPTEPRKE